ncbi:MAG: hypothetical protein JXA67_02900 [Micromonosporaceae bacterium]|nr:hypothetical protein [Micromonosporaceae bacterium]
MAVTLWRCAASGTMTALALFHPAHLAAGRRRWAQAGRWGRRCWSLASQLGREPEV